MAFEKIWKNKWRILEGIWNSTFPSEFVEEVASKRRAICETNQCGLYSRGESSACVIPGKPCCTGCGCDMSIKPYSLSSACYLQEIGKHPLWSAIMTQEDEDAFKKEYNIQDNA